MRWLEGTATAALRAAIRTDWTSSPSPAEIEAGLRSGDPAVIQDLQDRWCGVVADEPPVFAGDPDAVHEFLTANCLRCLVTPAEHTLLGKAKAGHRSMTLGGVYPAGAQLERYRNAGVNFVWLNG